MLFFFFFNKGNIEGTNFLKMCVWCLCMNVLCHVCVGTGFDWVYIDTCEKSLETCICLW